MGPSEVPWRNFCVYCVATLRRPERVPKGSAEHPAPPCAPPTEDATIRPERASAEDNGANRNAEGFGRSIVARTRRSGHRGGVALIG